MGDTNPKGETLSGVDLTSNDDDQTQLVMNDEENEAKPIKKGQTVLEGLEEVYQKAMIQLNKLRANEKAMTKIKKVGRFVIMQAILGAISAFMGFVIMPAIQYYYWYSRDEWTLGYFGIFNAFALPWYFGRLRLRKTKEQIENGISRPLLVISGIVMMVAGIVMTYSYVAMGLAYFGRERDLYMNANLAYSGLSVGTILAGIVNILMSIRPSRPLGLVGLLGSIFNFSFLLINSFLNYDTMGFRNFRDLATEINANPYLQPMAQYELLSHSLTFPMAMWSLVMIIVFFFGLFEVGKQKTLGDEDEKKSKSFIIGFLGLIVLIVSPAISIALGWTRLLEYLNRSDSDYFYNRYMDIYIINMTHIGLATLIGFISIVAFKKINGYIRFALMALTLIGIVTCGFTYNAVAAKEVKMENAYSNAVKFNETTGNMQFCIWKEKQVCKELTTTTTTTTERYDDYGYNNRYNSGNNNNVFCEKTKFEECIPYEYVCNGVANFNCTSMDWGYYNEKRDYERCVAFPGLNIQLHRMTYPDEAVCGTSWYLPLNAAKIVNSILLICYSAILILSALMATNSNLAEMKKSQAIKNLFLAAKGWRNVEES